MQQLDNVSTAFSVALYKKLQKQLESIQEEMSYLEQLAQVEEQVIVGPKGDKGDKGDIGPKGEVGATGPKGDTGPQGLTGPKGDKGDTGPEGQQGSQGIAGPKGDKGDRGEKGDQGIQGEQGIQGIQGEVGPKGDKGDQGEQGIQGEKGDAGKDGKDGAPGINGKDGIDGKDGKDGKDGLNGKDGINGKDGKDGIDGKDGKDGVDGKDGKDGKDADIVPISTKLEKDINNWKSLVNRQLESIGGGGAVNIRDMDDVDRTTALVDNKALVYQSSSGKFVGSEFKGTGGYEFTGGFLNRSNAITYTQAQADAGTWMRFGFSSAKQLTTDAPYWGNGPDPDEAPHSGTTDFQGVGTFSGAYMPSGVTQMIDYDDDTAYNQALTMSVTTAGVTENLPVTAAIGSYNFKQYKVGDFANIRVDFNVTPHVSNTTLNCALIWSTRDADDNITFTFPLTITPFFFGDNTAGKQVLTRPIFTAYFASQEDINARALFAIKSDNMITVEPFTSLTTVIAR